MDIRSKSITMVPIENLKPNPRNNNIHPPEQIVRLMKIIEKSGYRDPAIVSNQSGYVVSGHGRIEAAKQLGMKEIPCVFQDFESEDEEYIFMTQHNAIARWAELDFAQINSDIQDLGPFDIDLLGIKDFVVEPLDNYDLDNGPDIEKEERFVVEIEFETETDMIDTYNNLLSQGLLAKIKK